MAPNRTQLQSLTQGPSETFKEYAQKWRELAARVKPPMVGREMINMFTGTLSGHYFLACSTSVNFAEMVTYGERIESGLKAGKIQVESGSESNTAGKKAVHGQGKRERGESSAVYGRRGGDQPHVNVVTVPVNSPQHQG